MYVREDALLEAVHDFFADRIFGPDRRKHLAIDLDTSDQSARDESDRQRKTLQRKAADLSRRQERLITQLETAAVVDPTDPFIVGVRHRYNELAAELRAAGDQLRTLDTTPQPASQSIDLIDALPQIPGLLDELPEDLEHDLYAAFQLEVRYDRTRHRATLRATITDDTPRQLEAGVSDARAPAGLD